MNKAQICLAVLMFLAVSGHAAAPARVELTPFIAGRTDADFKLRDTGQEARLDASSAFGLVLGIPWQENSQLEFYYSRQATEVDLAPFSAGAAPVDFDLDTLQVGGTVFLPGKGSVLPFFVATAGGTRFKPATPGSKSDTFFSFGVGGGWKFFPHSRLGLRLEGRFIGTLLDSSSQAFCSIGGSGSSCLINTSGDLLWQFEAQAGMVYRF